VKQPLIPATIIALILASCVSNNLKQGPERADTDASLAYAGIATAVAAYEARAGITPVQTASAEALKTKAWEALIAERETYALAGAVDLTRLTALAVQAKALGN
jgi:hypothetical protein